MAGFCRGFWRGFGGVLGEVLERFWKGGCWRSFGGLLEWFCRAFGEVLVEIVVGFVGDFDGGLER